VVIIAVSRALPSKKTIAHYKASVCMPVGCCKIRSIGKSLIQGKVQDVVNCTQEFMPELITKRRSKKKQSDLRTIKNLKELLFQIG